MNVRSPANCAPGGRILAIPAPQHAHDHFIDRGARRPVSWPRRRSHAGARSGQFGKFAQKPADGRSHGREAYDDQSWHPLVRLASDRPPKNCTSQMYFWLIHQRLTFQAFSARRWSATIIAPPRLQRLGHPRLRAGGQKSRSTGLGSTRRCLRRRPFSSKEEYGGRSGRIRSSTGPSWQRCTIPAIGPSALGQSCVLNSIITPRASCRRCANLRLAVQAEQVARLNQVQSVTA